MKKERRHAKLWPLVLLGIVVLGVVLISGCIIDGPKEKPASTGEMQGKASAWCDVGSYFNMPGTGVKMVVTGIEKHTIEGVSVEMCCNEVEVSAEATAIKMKHCYSRDDDYVIQWLYNEEEGKYVKSMEMFPKGDKDCLRMYDTNGTVIMESCGEE